MYAMYMYVMLCMLQRVTAWCGFQSGNIIDPFFFEYNEEAIVSVNGKRYRAILTEYFFAEIKDEDMNKI